MKKISKTFIALLCLLAMLMPVFSGCAAGGPCYVQNEEEPVFDVTLATETMDAGLRQQNTIPGRSLDLARNNLQLKDSGRTGAGITVAIIDTGLDTSIPALNGGERIVDYQNFTDEGRLELTPVRVKDGTVQLDGRTYALGNITSQSGIVRWAVFAENSMIVGSTVGQDVNKNGTTDDRIAILCVDGEVSGRFDTVYVDTDGDLNFESESPLGIYKHTKTSLNLSPAGNGLSLVVCDLDRDGRELTLGFDGNSHGTAMAAIIGAEGEIVGIAPGADLMILKAVDSSGKGSWQAVYDAILYAAVNGADIVNISMAVSSTAGSTNPCADLIRTYTTEKDMLFIVAAGNSGPGSFSVSSLGAESAAVTVGAWLSASLWAENYGYEEAVNTVLNLSSTGPLNTGVILPDIVAPGVLYTANPVWAKDVYQQSAGTSAATAAVSGLCAQMLEDIQAEGALYTAASIKEALHAGARPMREFSALEQGGGRVSLSGALEAFYAEGLDLGVEVEVTGYSSFSPGGAAVLIGGEDLAEVEIRLTNSTCVSTLEYVFDLPEGVRCDRETLSLPYGKTRTLKLQLPAASQNEPRTLYLTGQEMTGVGSDLSIPITVLAPATLQTSRTFQDTVTPAVCNRHYIQVEGGTASLTVHLNLAEETAPGCFIRVMLFDPQGQKVHTGRFIGTGHVNTADAVTLTDPMPGTWELIVYQSATGFGLKKNEVAYSLTAAADCFTWSGNRNFALSGGQEAVISLYAKNGARTFDGQVELWTLYNVEEKTEDLVVEKSKGDAYIRLHVPENTYSLTVDLTNPAGMRGDIDLYLYREEGSRALYVASGTMNDTIEEHVTVFFPEAGDYILRALAAESLTTSVPVSLHYKMESDSGDGTAAGGSGQWLAHASVPVAAAFKAPGSSGVHKMVLMVSDDTGRRIGYTELSVAVGLGEIAVFAQRSPNGQFITVSVKDAATHIALDGPITIAGREYLVYNGTVTIQADGAETLSVAMDKDGYGPYRGNVYILNA